MNILVIGGTRFFGIPMVHRLIERGDDVTIATRGLAADDFGDRVKRIRLDISDEQSARGALNGRQYDVVIDKMGYCSNEIKWILESLRCDRFIHMSTAGVYQMDHFGITEDEFDGRQGELVWCDRRELPYDDVKRNAERVLCQLYPDLNWVSVRSPFVLGKNDYTRRLLFYVERTLTGRPIAVDNLDNRFSVCACNELSDFLVFLTDSTVRGPVNACAEGVISLREILNYIEDRTGRCPRLSLEGDVAPYNGTRDNSLNTNRAKIAGFAFDDVHTWIYRLLDYYIDEVSRKL